ncbi:MAG: hypothetical protein ACK58L_00475 [Planctomycetota bacterium]
MVRISDAMLQASAKGPFQVTTETIVAGGDSRCSLLRLETSSRLIASAQQQRVRDARRRRR